MSIVRYWPQWFKDLYGGEWPTSYCCIDVETSGFHLTSDVITQWAHVLVEDGEVKDARSAVLNWTNHSRVGDHWLRSKLDYTARTMEDKGRRMAVDYRRMKQEGGKPEEVLEFIRDFTSRLLAKNFLFVAHGGSFDEKMLASNFLSSGVARGFSFGDNGLMDTEGLVKASQIPHNERVHPRQGDTLRTYFHRVRYTKEDGVKSNLDTHCYEAYGFDRHGITRDSMHDALTDCKCCRILMQAFADQSASVPAATPAGPPPGMPPPAPARPPARRVRRQRNS